MSVQVSKEIFAKALKELGYDPSLYQGQKISLDRMAKMYEFEIPSLLDAIEVKKLRANYDYKEGVVWIDALEAAYFYYCVLESSHPES